MKRPKLTVLGFCLIFGLFIGLSFFLQGETKYIILISCLAFFAILIGTCVINLLYFFFYQRKIKKTVYLLETERPQEFIEETQKLLQTAKGSILQKNLQFNLTAGYIDLGQYDVAIRILEALWEWSSTSPAIKALHRLNLCVAYLESNQDAKAIALYEENRELFKQHIEKYKQKSNCGVLNISILEIQIAMRKGEYQQVSTLLCAIQKQFPTISVRAQKDLDKIVAQLEEVKAQNPGE